ncbi:MAG TPA: class D sortase [Terriglobia bacterium]|nr:class D sortase [Terriglobia bacterium]
MQRLWGSHLTPPARILYRVKLVSWGFGILALAYVGWVVAGAAVYQFRSRETLTHLQEQRHSRLPGGPTGSMRAPAIGSVLADLDIPRIGLSVMVTEGTDETRLRLGAGHLTGSGFPGKAGNVVIAGHRDTFFRSLRSVRVGDEIDLTALEGTYRYRVEWTRVVSPTDTQALDSTPAASLTLVTCYPFSYIGSAGKRFVVRAPILEGKRVSPLGPKREPVWRQP